MSKRLPLLAALLVGLVIGLVPTLLYKAKAYSLAKFSEEMGCTPMPAEFMKDTPAPGAKALVCMATGTVIVIL